MRRLVYMNHHLKDPRPRAPVVVLQEGGRRRSTNRLRLYAGGKLVAEVRFQRRALREVETHSVRAYVELAPHVRAVASRQGPR